MRTVNGGTALVIALLIVCSAPSAQAAPCNRPDLLYAFPPDGATNVPTDARLYARYSISAEYIDEIVELRRVGGTEEWFPQPEFDKNESMLSITPPEPLVPGESYELSWPGVRGIATATRGRGRTLTFTVGSGPDTELPRFDGLRSIDWTIDREHDECTESLEERFLFELEPGLASDDGGRDSLVLLVYQTRGKHIDPDSRVPVLMRSLPDAGQSVTVSRTVRDGLGEACFSAHVRDLLGNISGGAEQNVCVTTVEPPFFEGCSIAAPPRRAFAPAALLAMLALFARRYAKKS